MVAIFNGVGGGAVALLAWVEFRGSGGYAHDPTYVAIFTVFAAIVGSISFWGSAVAFAKLQELIGGKPITAGRLQTPLNLLFGLVAVGSAVAIVAGGAQRARLPRPARQRRCPRLPARAADRRRRHAGRHLAPQRVHRALRSGDRRCAGQQRPDRRGHARGRLGHLADPADGGGHEPLRTGDRGGRLWRNNRAAHGRGRDGQCTLDHRGGCGDPARLRTAGRDCARLWPRRQSGTARAPQHDQAPRLPRDHGEVRRPSRRRPHARPHERAPRRGRGALRPARRNG